MSATMGVSIVPGQTALMRIPRGGVLEGGALGQAEHAVFGGVEGGAAGEPDEAAERGAVDDRAAALLAHLSQLVLDARPDAAEVDRIDVLEVVGRLVCGVTRRDHDPGVVEGHVQPAEARHRAVDQSGDLVFVGDVADDGERPVVGGRQPVGGGAQRVLFDVGEYYGSAVCAEGAGGREPHPGAGSGDEATCPLKSLVGFTASLLSWTAFHLMRSSRARTDPGLLNARTLESRRASGTTPASGIVGPPVR
jgi:hypothetical protein